MWTELLAAFFPAAGYLLWIGAQLIGAGTLGIWLTRRDLILGPVPEPLAVARPPKADGGVIRTPVLLNESGCELAPPPRPGIPGAMPPGASGPVCPICGGPFHPVCPSAPKERTEERDFAGVIEASDAAIRAAYDLAPQFAALGRFFEAVAETRADTAEAMDRIAEAVRPDCPLTTQEIPPLDPSMPLYDTTVRRADTQDLSAVMEKVRQA